jgi:hypothetical protein
MNYWLINDFFGTGRSRLLVLIGPTGVGKRERIQWNHLFSSTCCIFSYEKLGKNSFARSLPGPFIYMKSKWRLKSWKNNARYIIMDGIPWDDFDDKKKKYMRKKAILACNEPPNVRNSFWEENYVRFVLVYVSRSILG